LVQPEKCTWTASFGFTQCARSIVSGTTGNGADFIFSARNCFQIAPSCASVNPDATRPTYRSSPCSSAIPSNSDPKNGREPRGSVQPPTMAVWIIDYAA
jgi:hypothetical protein